MWVKKRQLEPDMKQLIGSKLGWGTTWLYIVTLLIKLLCRVCVCMLVTQSCRNAGLDESQAGIKTAGRNISNFRYADDTTLMAENDEELKRVKEESEKASLKLNIQKTKIMASSPITSWQIDVGKVEAVIEFIFSRIIVDDDCSHEVKR